MQRVTMEPAYVLHARPYRETSSLLEVFTPDHGRMGLVARGARAGRSRWKNLLQPFRPLLVSWYQRGELGTLTAAEQVASPPAAQGQALFCGLYVNELLIRALHRADAQPELFEAYRGLLGKLASHIDPEPALRVFEKQLLDALGYGMQLECECDTGVPVSATAWYDWMPERGLVRRIPVAEATDATSNAKLISGEALLALQSDQIEAGHLNELKRLMRRVLRYHLGDRPLVSQSLFR